MVLQLLILLIKVEPYWNVNKILGLDKMQNGGIKVEPYWNVNSK